MLLFRKMRILSLLRPISIRTFSKNEKQNYRQSNQHSRRTQQIDFRSRMMEEEQLRRIRQSVETTKGDLNPVIQYIKLFRSKLLSLMILGIFTVTAIVIAKVGGVHQDPFINKKKIVLISDDFEKSIDGNLRQTFLSHFGISKNVSGRIQQQCKTIQAYLKQTTNRAYRLLLVSSQDKVLIFLPGSIIMSKGLLLTTNKKDLQTILLVMQTLFVKKSHIKQLAFSNIFHFLSHWLKPTNVSDINMLKIYSRPYSKIEIYQTLSQASKKYSLSTEDMQTCISNIIKEDSSVSSNFSVKSRLGQIIQAQNG